MKHECGSKILIIQLKSVCTQQGSEILFVFGERPEIIEIVFKKVINRTHQKKPGYNSDNVSKNLNRHRKPAHYRTPSPDWVDQQAKDNKNSYAVINS